MIISARQELAFWLALQAATLLWVIHRFWIRERTSTGLPLAYVGLAVLTGWLPKAIYLLPWYAIREPDLLLVEARYSTLAIAMFALGCFLVADRVGVLWKSERPDPSSLVHRKQKFTNKPDYSLFRTFTAVGLLLFFVVLPAVQGTPTLTAIVSGGALLVIAGPLGAYYVAQIAEDRRTASRLLLFILVLALVTVFLYISIMGFFGFAPVLLLILLAMTVRFVRIRIRHLLIVMVAMYLGLTFVQTYFRDRPMLRALTWGRAPYSARLAQLWATFTHPEWFNPWDPWQLDRITGRFGQTSLFGRAVVNLEKGYVDYAYGETFLTALYALIPRALWPDKPIRAGGHELVSRYTGLFFDKNTSVGLGLMFEIFINFGPWGYALGSLLLGILYRVIDRRMWLYAMRSNYERFLLWFIFGISLLRSGELWTRTLLPSTVAALGLAYSVCIAHEVFRGRRMRVAYKF